MKKLIPLLSLFILLASCDVDVQKDGLNIKSMYFDSVPTSAIKVGEFDAAGIKLCVTYSNNKTEEYPVTEDWLPEEHQHYLGEPGSYTVSILFRDKTVNLNFTMEANERAPSYQVTFLNYRGVELESYTISHRLDAEFHGVVEEREGYDFVGWDQSLYGVHKNMVYHPIYEVNPDNITE